MASFLVHVRCGFSVLIEHPERHYFCVHCRQWAPDWQIERWVPRQVRIEGWPASA